MRTAEPLQASHASPGLQGLRAPRGESGFPPDDLGPPLRDLRRPRGRRRDFVRDRGRALADPSRARHLDTWGAYSASTRATSSRVADDALELESGRRDRAE